MVFYTVVRDDIKSDAKRLRKNILIRGIHSLRKQWYEEKYDKNENVRVLHESHSAETKTRVRKVRHFEEPAKTIKMFTTNLSMGVCSFFEQGTTSVVSRQAGFSLYVIAAWWGKSTDWALQRPHRCVHTATLIGFIIFQNNFIVVK